tara:strand:- start:216 stop:1085 length:870 start_codon:yes stop_codon:yes gene_type:complete
MPEGPEVKRTTERLNRFLQGSKLQEIVVEDERWFQNQVRDEVNVLFNSLSNGPLEIKQVNCKGKFIYFQIDNFDIHHTLGMTGSWRFPGRGDKKGRRLVLKTDKGEICYVDKRKFGTFKIFYDKPDILTKKLDSLGPDLLNEEVSEDIFVSRMRGDHTRKGYNHKEVTQVMMDQKAVAGIGNYIKAEALYMAEINPYAKVGDLSDDELKELGKACIWVIKASYAAKGATIRNYKLPNGDVGEYKFKFKVYSKRKDPVGNKVIREETADKRTTHWVPEVQTRGVTTQNHL